MGGMGESTKKFRINVLAFKLIPNCPEGVLALQQYNHTSAPKITMP
jgi:hypothetical protein